MKTELGVLDVFEKTLLQSYVGLFLVNYCSFTPIKFVIFLEGTDDNLSNLGCITDTLIYTLSGLTNFV